MGGTLAAKVIEQLGRGVVAVCDADPAKTAPYVAMGAIALAATELVGQCDYVVLGVKPQVLDKVLAPLVPALAPNATIVSMAAGVDTAHIAAIAGPRNIVRIMPNLPAAVGQGTIVYTTAAWMTPDQCAAVLPPFVQAFALCGTLVPIDEAKIDAASAVSGCGPAFVYMFVEAMAAAGVECGLDYATALTLAAQTTLGAAAMVQAKGDPAALRNAVCSPGGTTIVGVHTLEQQGMRAAVMDAIVAAYQRSKKLV